MAKSLFAIGGVKSIFFGRDFITVTKLSPESWQLLTPQIFAKIMDFYAGDVPIVLDNPMVSDTTILGTYFYQ